jgi:uncharacterized protein YdeI (YjbR/CyaY-like superfamily)
MGTECYILGIRKEIREQTGKTFGDLVEITVQEDTEPRVVEIPAELMRALEADSEASALFEKLSYTHQREYVTWIEEARKVATRQRRIMKTIEMVKQKKKAR